MENKNNANKPSGANAAAVPAKGLATKKVILILGSVAIVCAAAVVIALLLRQEPAPSGVPVIDGNNLNEIVSEIEEKVARGMFETHMNTTWNFPDGASASSDAVMGNAAANNFPFWFTVTLSDTGEIVYTSSLLPVGSALAEIVLDKDLDAGTYPAVVTFHMVDDAGEEVESNMGINIMLIVNN
jgi:hypothetical protein